MCVFSRGMYVAADEIDVTEAAAAVVVSDKPTNEAVSDEPAEAAAVASDEPTSAAAVSNEPAEAAAVGSDQPAEVPASATTPAEVPKSDDSATASAAHSDKLQDGVGEATPSDAQEHAAPRRAARKVVTICEDTRKECNRWARAGECSRNPGFMSASCRLSCGKCGVDDEAGGETREAAERQLTAEQDEEDEDNHEDEEDTHKDCFDIRAECPSWSSQGECSKNPRYMEVNCRASCGVCKR